MIPHTALIPTPTISPIPPPELLCRTAYYPHPSIVVLHMLHRYPIIPRSKLPHLSFD